MTRKIGKQNRWRKAVNDPVLFCREFLEFEPHKGQAEWLENSNRSQNLLVTGNRWGKSLIEAAKIIHRAVFRIRGLRFDHDPRYRILNVSITQDQANIIFKNCLGLIKGKSLLELLVDKVTYTPHPKLEFGNGVEVTARSSQNRGEYILGNDYDFICFDEVAFELHPEYVVDEILTMRLADRRGMLDLVSTPHGKNWFYRKSIQLKADPRIGYVQCGSSIENPYLSAEFLQTKIETMPQARVQQNIYGMFIDTGNEIINEEYIQNAIQVSSGLATKAEHHRYVHGWDLARKKTFTVGVTLEVTSKPYQLVSLERFQNREWPFVYEAIRKRKLEYGGDVMIDSTGIGDVVLGELQDIKALGFLFTARSKSELLTNLQSQFEAGNVGVPYIECGTPENNYWNLIDELRELNWDSNTEADACMALALALWLVKESSAETVPPGFRLGEI